MEVTQAPEAPEPTVVTVPADAPATIANPSEAARILRAARTSKQKAQEAPQEAASSEPVTESAPEASDAVPVEEPPVTTEEASAEVPPELPPVERPRSWSADETEAWNALPRTAQERLAERERARDVEIRRSQNEVAEQRKAIEAELEAAKLQRQQYEQALEWTLSNSLNGPDAAQFADIKTPADARRLATDDPLRYTQYQAWRDETRQLAEQYQQVQAQKQQEQTQSWQTFATKEDALFAEKVPDIADPAKQQKITAETVAYLTDGLGFSKDEIVQAWNTPAWRDHRAQLALYHAAKHWNASRQIKSTPPKPLPPVQRPGVAQGRNAAQEQHIKALEERLNRTANPKDAAALLRARRGIRS